MRTGRVLWVNWLLIAGVAGCGIESGSAPTSSATAERGRLASAKSVTDNDANLELSFRFTPQQLANEVVGPGQGRVTDSRFVSTRFRRAGLPAER